MNVWELLYLPGLDESLARVEAELRRAVLSPIPFCPKWLPTSSTPAANGSDQPCWSLPPGYRRRCR